jgi:uncharacterized protein
MSQTLTAGIHRSTGKLLTEGAHIAQSVADILTTPLGTRVMRENYGSLLPELIDQPQGAALDLKLIAAAFMAIIVWEPRIKPTKMTLGNATLDGRRELLLQAVRNDGQSAGRPISFSTLI